MNRRLLRIAAAGVSIHLFVFMFRESVFVMVSERVVPNFDGEARTLSHATVHDWKSRISHASSITRVS
jgi:hypothetical protein